MKQKFSAVFRDQANSLPCTEQSADGKSRDVGSICQLFIRDLETYATGSSAANAMCQADKDMGKAFASGVAGETEMSCQIPNEVVASDRYAVLEDSRVFCSDHSNYVALPRKRNALLDRLSAHDKLCRFGQKTRTSPNVAR